MDRHNRVDGRPERVAALRCASKSPLVSLSLKNLNLEGKPRRVASDDADKENADNSVAAVRRVPAAASPFSPAANQTPSPDQQGRIKVDLGDLYIPSFKEIQERKRHSSTSQGSNGTAANSSSGLSSSSRHEIEDAIQQSIEDPVRLSDVPRVLKRSPEDRQPLPAAKRATNAVQPQVSLSRERLDAFHRSRAPLRSLPLSNSRSTESGSKSPEIGAAILPAAAPFPFSRPLPTASSSAPSTAQQVVSGASNSLEPFSVLKVNGVKYIRLKLVGRGGYGKVFQCLDPGGRLCAIKKINLEQLSPRESSVQICKQEIAYMNKFIGNSHIVQLYNWEIVNLNRAAYMVMEYGELDLSRKLEQLRMQNVSLGVNYIRLYWQQMVECVAVIHKAGVIHADLKPANFLFVEGSLKLIDFGIAKAIERNDTTSVIQEVSVGSPNYMSPERFENLNSNPSSKTFRFGRPCDIWALGCILYQMTFGEPLLCGPGLEEKRAAVINPKVKLEIPETRHPFLSNVLRRCLVKDPEHRATISELQRDPFLGLSEAPLVGPSVSASSVEPKRRRRET